MIQYRPFFLSLFDSAHTHPATRPGAQDRQEDAAPGKARNGTYSTPLWGTALFPGTHRGVRTEGLKYLMMSERTKERAALRLWPCRLEGTRKVRPPRAEPPGWPSLFQSTPFSTITRKVSLRVGPWKRMELKASISAKCLTCVKGKLSLGAAKQATQGLTVN